MLTPQTVDNILKNYTQRKAEHDLNANDPLITGCKIGAVFAYNGDYYVYVGLNARKKKPLIAVNAETRRCYKFPASFFERVRSASK